MKPMRSLVGPAIVLGLLLALPSSGEAASRAGRIGFGYSLYPIAEGMGTLRYDSYRFFFEGGFRLVDHGDSQIAFGSKIAVKPWEYYGIPVEMGGSIAFLTNGTMSDKGEAATLVDLGFLVGLSTLVTDQVSVGAALYPLALGLGGAKTATHIGAATFNIHFLF
ncbi:MAG: hypothetical protein ABIH26_11815 [Candidatus Eisenbacteria bacterium]